MSSFRKPYTINRTNPGAYVNGEWVAGSATTVAITATIQPVSDQDLINFPAGTRSSDVVKIYTATELNTVEDMGENQQPDRIDWFGHTYEITAKSVRQMSVINHYRYWATKVPVQ
jgi:hypothetical protein